MQPIRGWVVPECRFLTDSDVAALRDLTASRVRATNWGKRSIVLEWIVIELALYTGLRVSEIASMVCGDLALRPDGGSLVVRNGKGGKPRVVKYGAALAGELVRFLEWKRCIGESADEASPLLLSSNTGSTLTSRALQKMFFRIARAAGVNGHRFHDLRHTNASHLYRASGHNLRLVQKQLGHASIRTTQVYADVFDEETERAVNRLYESPASTRQRRSALTSALPRASWRSKE